MEKISLDKFFTVYPTYLLNKLDILKLMFALKCSLSSSTSTSTYLKAEIALFPLDPATRESLFSGLFLTKLQIQLQLELIYV